MPLCRWGSDPPFTVLCFVLTEELVEEEALLLLLQYQNSHYEALKNEEMVKIEMLTNLSELTHWLQRELCGFEHFFGLGSGLVFASPRLSVLLLPRVIPLW